MSAANTDLFTKVGDPGTATTLSSPGYTIGNSSINVGATADFPTDTGVIFGIDTVTVVNGAEVRVSGSYCVFAGTVSTGTSITNLTLLYGTPQNYASGSLTRVYITTSAEWANRLISGILLHANQDGSLKSAAAVAALVSQTVNVGDLQIGGTTLETMLGDLHPNFVVPGTGVIAQSSGLVGTFADVTYYIAGKRYTKTSISNKTYTASKDTYVDIDTSGNITYTEVTNGATSGMTLAANSVRVAKVITSGSAITSVSQSGPQLFSLTPPAAATTTSTSFVAIGTNNTTLTLIKNNAYTVVEIDVTVGTNIATANAAILFGVSVDGAAATLITQSFDTTTDSAIVHYSGHLLVKALAAGSHMFTLQWKVNSASGTAELYSDWSTVQMVVKELPNEAW